MAYLLAVLLTAGAFTVHALDLAVRTGPDVPHAWRQGAGRPRPVDVERFRTLIRERRLSDHPALFVHPAD